jgi:hypothetical protein
MRFFPMRRCVPAVLFAALLLTGRTAFADSIAVGDTLHLLDPGGPPIWGGEFAVDVDGIGTPGIVDFVTFCVQQASDINGTDTFTVAAVGDPSIPGQNTTDDGDPLDDRTAWIYLNYRQDPQGFVSTYTEDGIQAAIWLIEEESYFTNRIFSSLLEASVQDKANALKAAAQNAVLGGFVNTNVRIVQLVFPDLSEAQDLLVLDDGLTTQHVHMPEPATLVLVGSGVAGLIRRHSKRRRTP